MSEVDSGDVELAAIAGSEGKDEVISDQEEAGGASDTAEAKVDGGDVASSDQVTVEVKDDVAPSDEVEPQVQVGTEGDASGAVQYHDGAVPPPPGAEGVTGGYQAVNLEATDETSEYYRGAPPDLEVAKAHFRSLQPRRIRDTTQPSGYRLARPGETVDRLSGEKAEPYHWWESDVTMLDEFGMGVGLYFRSLVLLGCLVLLCAFVSLGAVVENAKFNPDDLGTTLQGSAVGATPTNFTGAQGASDLAVTLLLLLFCFSAGRLQRETMKKIDESVQSAQDYAVVIKNPPPDARDPDEWKKFFEDHFGEVVFITVAVDNGQLIATLAEIRLLKHQLRQKRRGDNIDGMKKTLGEKQALAAMLSKRRPNVNHVYVVFDKEHSQRNCLQKLGQSRFKVFLRESCCLCPRGQYQFRNQILRAKEPVEPEEILWENLDVSRWRQAQQQSVALLIAGGVLAAAYGMLSSMGSGGSVGSAMVVALVNIALPVIMRFIGAKFEKHRDMSAQLHSLLHKLVLARMINSAILVFSITAYEDKLSEESIQKVFNILLADAISVPLNRLIDPVSRINQGFLAPRAATQDQMNFLFRGQYWNLAERYSDMLKTLFVALFYLPLLPTGLFITAGACFTTYWVDKFGLLYRWQRKPPPNESLAATSRHYMFAILIVHMYMAANYFSGWPFIGGELYRSHSDGLMLYGVREEEYRTQAQYDYHTTYFVLFVMASVGWVAYYVLLSPLQSALAACCCASSRTHGTAQTASYRDVHGISTYVPQIMMYGLVHPVLACPITFPRNYLSFHRGADAAEHCLVSETDLPDLTPEERSAAFSVVKFYPRVKSLPPQHKPQAPNSSNGAAAPMPVPAPYQQKQPAMVQQQAMMQQQQQQAMMQQQQQQQAMMMQQQQQPRVMRQQPPQQRPMVVQQQQPPQQQQQQVPVQMRYAPAHQTIPPMQQQPLPRPVSAVVMSCSSCSAHIQVPSGYSQVKCGQCGAVLNVAPQ